MLEEKKENKTELEKAKNDELETPEKNIIAYVMKIPEGAIESIRKYEAELGTTFRIMLITDSKVTNNAKLDYKPVSNKVKDVDIKIECDISNPDDIAAKLLPYQAEMLAISCRSEQSMARFAKIIPHLPYLYTPTTESLQWASDKYLMRKRLRIYDPKITPKFTLVRKNTTQERERIAKKVGFPMIVKPTNMAASLFVSICYHEEDLKKTLNKTLKKLKKAYKNDNRLEEPKVIAEEYMDGDLYSVDSFVGMRGGVQHCPLVRQITAKSIGRDDFYNYIQMTPPDLKKETVEKAEEVAKKAIHALGIRNSIAHTELMKVDDEWKVVEIAARMGGFRHELHHITCGADHSLNDILIRIPKKFTIPKKITHFACAVKWFAEKEGVITEMKGLKKIEQLESFHSIDISKKVGDRSEFARNGGRSVFNLILKNTDRSKLLADIRRVEQTVVISVEEKPAKRLINSLGLK